MVSSSEDHPDRDREGGDPDHGPGDKNSSSPADSPRSDHPGADVTVDAPISEKPGTIIGRYKLLQEIGEGGFGVVYMAEQREPVRRIVALKVIKLGMDTRQVIARFEAERQALALMDHPNIAQVFDAGATPAGRPYFVMELVKGVPITDYCDLNNLDTRERQELFIPVCNAIQHAHQKGIIHRDIKPSNIMITLHDGKPVPKVIDFGVAKATSAQLTTKTLYTRYEQMIGTPAYMSPEQAEMSGLDIDTRSDIYALGVLLYEILTGTTPISSKTLARVAVAEIQRIIREEEPPKPSTRLSSSRSSDSGESAARTSIQLIARHRHTDPVSLRRLLRGDLDWIVMRCLEKDRTRRYVSAADLADDIRRHLDDQPVEAGPPGARYRLGKLIRRNRAAFATGAVVAASLVIALVASTSGYVRAREAELTAVTERDAANAARRMAEEQRTRADRQAEDLRRQLYASRISSIASAIDDANFLGLRELLESCPENLRNWEWHRLAWQLADRSVRTLSVRDEHHRGLSGVAIGGGGDRLLSAGADGRLNVWSVSTGRVVQRLIAEKAGVHAVDLSADGRTALVAGDDGVQLLDAATGRRIRRWSGDGFALSPDGTRVVIYEGQESRVHGVETEEPMAMLPGFSGFADFSPDGERVAFTDNRYGINVLDLSLETVLQLPRLGSSVSAVAFSPDGRLIVSGNTDKSVRLWDPAGGDALHTLRGHQDTVVAVAMDPRGERVASGGRDRTVRLWDASTGECLAVFLGHDAPVRRISFTSSGEEVVSVGTDGVVKVWASDVAPTTLTFDAGSEASVLTLCVSYRPDGRQIASAGSSRTVTLWDPDTGRLMHALEAHDYWVYAVAYRPPDGRMLASSDDGGYVRLWDTHSGALLRTIRPESMDKWGQIRSLAFSPDGTRLAGTSQNMECVYVWDPDTGRQLRKLEQSGRANAVALSADGTMMAHAGTGGAVLLRDADTGEVHRTLAAPREITSLAFNPAGTRLLAGDRDGRLHVWETSSGDRLALLESHGGAVTSVIYGSDGQRIIAAFRDNSVRIWSVSGEELLILRGHDDTVNCVALSPDGRSIASASRDGSVRVWETGPPPSGDTARRIVREATALAGRMRREHSWTIHAIEAIELDRSLDRAVRDEAVRRLVAGGYELNEKSWRVAREPGRPSEDYRLAVRTAELAVQLHSENASWTNTLGIAQYRAEQYEEARATLQRAMVLNRASALLAELSGKVEFSSAAFLAMIEHQFGRTDTARELLAKLTNEARQGRCPDCKRAWVDHEELAGFIGEAESLITGSGTRAEP